jgi:hypothetical protein
MQIVETPVYTFDELSDEAKERARDWFREGVGEDAFWAESVIEDFGRICDLIGIALDTHPVTLMSGKTRYDPSVWYSLGYTQSDFAGFDGSYAYKTGAAKKLREYAPQDQKLHAIGDALQALQARYAYAITAMIKHSDYWGLTVEPETRTGRVMEPGDVRELADAFKALCRWLYAALQGEYEYQTSNEQLDDGIRANEYTFTEDGKRFG